MRNDRRSLFWGVVVGGLLADLVLRSQDTAWPWEGFILTAAILVDWFLLYREKPGVDELVQWFLIEWIWILLFAAGVGYLVGQYVPGPSLVVIGLAAVLAGGVGLWGHRVLRGMFFVPSGSLDTRGNGNPEV